MSIYKAVYLLNHLNKILKKEHGERLKFVSI